MTPANWCSTQASRTLRRKSRVRRYGQFAECEDTAQEAVLEAAQQWPDGIPQHSKAWLVTLATRRLVDLWRSEAARQAWEERAAALEPVMVDDGGLDDARRPARELPDETLVPLDEQDRALWKKASLSKALIYLPGP